MLPAPVAHRRALIQSTNHGIHPIPSHSHTPHNTQVQSAVGGVGGGGWKTPFFLLFLLIGVCMALIYRWYEKLRKSHVL